jgi:hypothetical protein
MIELRKKSLPKSGIGMNAISRMPDDPDLVLQDREDRLIRLVGRLELSDFTIKHVAFRFPVKSAR